MFAAALRNGIRVGAGAAIAFSGSVGYYYVHAKESTRYIIYAGPGMEELALKLVRQDPGKHRYLPITWTQRADGSSDVKVAGLQDNDVTNEDILFLASFGDSDSLLAQYTALYSLCDSVINSMTIVAPYMPGTVAGNATPAARLLSNLPACGRPHRIVSYDTDVNISGSAKASIYTTAPLVSELMKTKQFDCLAFNSAETYSRYRSSIKGRPTYVRIESKTDALSSRAEPEIMEGSPSGKHVLLVDSVLHKAETPIAVAKKLKAQGALSVSLFCTHAVPSAQQDLTSIAEDDAIHKVYITNSYRPAKAQLPRGRSKFEVLDLTPVILKDI
eukprot:TRINITY_DN25931_c0_g2_i1.p2 TRINITY_DN25931_c0_g2~~TRINITY_DN25931_c0_g2_i1.p2  ORF type:complete len:330 (+),score=151.38 TRINITY_DN25931_c0_g2_i1:55-1044(+)